MRPRAVGLTVHERARTLVLALRALCANAQWHAMDSKDGRQERAARHARFVALHGLRETGRGLCAQRAANIRGV